MSPSTRIVMLLSLLASFAACSARPPLPQTRTLAATSATASAPQVSASASTMISVSAPVPEGSSAPPPKPVALSSSAIDVEDWDERGMHHSALAYDPALNRVWMARRNGAVKVLDVATGRLTRIGGFPSKVSRGEEVSIGVNAILGPCSVAIGEAVAYLSSEATPQICVIDSKTFKLVGCVKGDTQGSTLAYVSATKELWLLGLGASIDVMSATVSRQLRRAGRVELSGEVQTHAVDQRRGVFYTWLLRADQILAIDVRTRSVKESWVVPCGGFFGRSLAIDEERARLFVGCKNSLQVFDIARSGALISKLVLESEVRAIAHAGGMNQIYMTAPRKFVVAQVGAEGSLSVVGSAAASEWSAQVLAGANGTAFVSECGALRTWRIGE